MGPFQKDEKCEQKNYNKSSQKDVKKKAEVKSKIQFLYRSFTRVQSQNTIGEFSSFILQKTSGKNSVFLSIDFLF